MERKATSLQGSVKSSDKEDEQPVTHDQAKLTEAQEDQRPKQKRGWLKRISSCKWTATFIAVTTLLGYVLLNIAVSVIAPFYSIWVSLQLNCCYGLARSNTKFMHVIFLGVE